MLNLGAPGGAPISLPTKATLVVGASIFAVELAIMLVLSLFRLPALPETVVDAASLLLVVTPILYAFILRPLTAEISARKKAESELREQAAPATRHDSGPRIVRYS